MPAELTDVLDFFRLKPLMKVEQTGGSKTSSHKIQSDRESLKRYDTKLTNIVFP